MVSALVFRWTGRVKFTSEGHQVQQLHDGLATRLREPNSRGEMVGRALNQYLSEVQPGWDLQ